MSVVQQVVPRMADRSFRGRKEWSEKNILIRLLELWTRFEMSWIPENQKALAMTLQAKLEVKKELIYNWMLVEHFVE
jgi:hypothetical protein